jgi:predicted nucleotidyltransferase
MALTESVTRDSKLAHLTENERQALAELVERLHRRHGDDLLRVVLFGSKARGDFDEESDLIASAASN